jgi:outer membrane protein
MKTFARSPVTSGLAAVAIAAAGLAAAPTVSAQELKIGYVNSERVLREAAPAQAAQRKLEAEFSKRQREMTEAEQRLKAAADRLEKDAPTLAAGDRSRRERELVEQDRDLQRKRREFQEDLNQRRNEELSAVVERANRAIKQIFDSEKYDLILQEVLFAGTRVDITDKVIRVLNAPAAATPAPAPR